MGYQIVINRPPISGGITMEKKMKLDEKMDKLNDKLHSLRNDYWQLLCIDHDRGFALDVDRVLTDALQTAVKVRDKIKSKRLDDEKRPF